MNPHANPSIAPTALLKSVIKNRRLIFSMVSREVVGRYRGSTLGILWSFFNPLLMLTVYTFVFSVVFKARWPGGGESKVEFALTLFTGLLIYNLFSECINRAPTLILGNANFVKKIIFPLEILPIVSLGSSAFHLLISIFVWIIFYLIFFGIPGAIAISAILLLVPLSAYILGITFVLSSLGVYLRDISQITGVLTTVLMFLTPIFYPISALPEKYWTIMKLNPLTYIVEEARHLMIFSGSPHWNTLLIHTLISVVILSIGFAWFQKTRRGFADVI